MADNAYIFSLVSKAVNRHKNIQLIIAQRQAVAQWQSTYLANRTHYETNLIYRQNVLKLTNNIVHRGKFPTLKKKQEISRQISKSLIMPPLYEHQAIVYI
jgi:hypothetical protein